MIREVHEEVGITVRDPRYLGSQPWPFPRSLGCSDSRRSATRGAAEFLDGEIGDAIWFHRDEVRGRWPRVAAGRGPTVRYPPVLMRPGCGCWLDLHRPCHDRGLGALKH